MLVDIRKIGYLVDKLQFDLIKFIYYIILYFSLFILFYSIDLFLKLILFFLAIF